MVSTGITCPIAASIDPVKTCARAAAIWKCAHVAGQQDEAKRRILEATTPG